MINEAELRRRYNELLPSLERIAGRLEHTLHETLQSIRFVDAISTRVKSKSSFLAKVLSNQEKYTSPFRTCEDVIGVRILVLFPQTADLVVNRLRSQILAPVEHSYRRPGEPSEFGYEGYQSIHSIPADLKDTSEDDTPRVCEVQVRTLFQHAAFEPEHEIHYKNAPALQHEEEYQYEKRLAWIAATAWGADRILRELYDTLPSLTQQPSS